jgi:hypothetical protein
MCLPLPFRASLKASFQFADPSRLLGPAVLFLHLFNERFGLWSIPEDQSRPSVGQLFPCFPKKPFQAPKIPFSLKGSAKVTFGSRYASVRAKVFSSLKRVAGYQRVGADYFFGFSCFPHDLCWSLKNLVSGEWGVFFFENRLTQGSFRGVCSEEEK